MNTQSKIIIFLVIALIGFAGYILYQEINQSAYEKGFVAGQTSLVMEQTRTGIIYYLDNSTIKSASLNQICGRGEK